MAQEVKVEKVPWALVIVLTIFSAAFGMFWNSLIPFSLNCEYNLGTIEWVMEITLAPFIGMMILAALAQIKYFREKMNLTKVTYLYTVIMITMYFVVPVGYPFRIVGHTIYDRIKYAEKFEIAFPWFMVPQEDIAKQTVAGGIPVPWAEWLPSILFWWIVVFLVSFFLVCVANIFRRQWLDVEKVTFPITVAAYEIYNIAGGGSESKKERYKIFILGMVLGFIVQAPIGLAMMFPWFPDIYGWRVNTCPSGLGYNAPDSPLASIAGLVGWRKTPVPYFIGYLVPISILFNIWFWFLVYIILSQISYMIGYYTGILQMNVCARAYCEATPMYYPPLETAVVAGMGGTIMLTIMTLFLSRSYIIETIRAALGKLPTDKIREVERNEAISYRLNYLAIVVSFVLIVGLFLACGVGILSAILIPIVAFVWWFSTLRVYGATGISTGTATRGLAFPRLIFGEWGSGGPIPLTRDFVVTTFFMRSLSSDMPSMGWGGGMLSSFAGYKMASATGTSNKGVFKIIVSSTLIAPLVSIVTFLLIIYTYGTAKLPMGAMAQGSNMDQYIFRASSEGGTSWIPYALFGMVMVGFLSIMHARFIWFPFEPIGFIIGWSDTGICMAYWSSAAVAWVAKFLTLRIGGSKAYETYGVPFAVGAIAGCMISIFIIGNMYVLRFFVPF